MLIRHLFKQATRNLPLKPLNCNKTSVRCYWRRPIKELAKESESQTGNIHYSNFGAYIRLFSLAAVIGAYFALTSDYSAKLQSKFGGATSHRSRYNFINEVAALCAPAVVYVEIQDPRRIDRATKEPLIISNGSGFIVREDGWILTNAHVVISKPQAIINVQMLDGSTHQATVEDADMNIDLALLKIDVPNDKKLPVLRFGNAGDVSVGEWVVALGSPLSLSHSVTVGVVSSINRDASDLGLINLNMRYIQTDAAVTFGNSGGPLVNLDGNVIGINNLRITSGIAFAIPVEYVNKFLYRSNQYTGKVNPNKDETILGITTIKMNQYVLQDLLKLYKDYPSDVNHGILVWKVLENGLAKSNGLKTGDIITDINGVPIKDSADIYKVFMTKPTKSLSFNIIRQGEKIVIDFQTTATDT